MTLPMDNSLMLQRVAKRCHDRRRQQDLGRRNLSLKAGDMILVDKPLTNRST